MRLKRILASLFSLSLVLSPIHVYAEETIYASDYSGNQFNTIDSAWQAACSGTPITMLADWNLTDRLELDEGKTVTIEMNGFKIDRGLSESIMNGEVIYMDKNSKLTLTGILDNSFEVKKLNEDTNGNVSTTVSIGGLVTGGASKNGGGGIHMKKGCQLTLDHVGVMGNSSETYSASGGGIFTDGDDCEINLNNGSQVSYNYAQRNGGGIYVNNEDTYITLNNSEISYNKSHDGGGIYSDDDATRITLDNHSKIDNNSAYAGGGIYFNDSYSLVQSNDSTGMISNNKVCSKAEETYGGAIFYVYVFIADHVGEVKNITFENNEATTTYSATQGQGGAICCHIKNLTISNCTFKNNVADKGGALSVGDDNMTIKDCTIENNTANINGGGIFVEKQTDLNLEGSLKVQNNTLSTDDSKNDIYLDHDSYATSHVSGTPSKGSSVGILGSGEIQVGINQSEDNGSFFCDAGNYYLELDGNALYQKLSVTGSIFGNGNTIIALCVMLGVGVIGAVILVVNKKKKKA